MEYIKGIENYKYNTPCAVTVGKLDALHRGHQLLLDNINAQKAFGMKSVVIIFSVSPRLVFNKPEIDSKSIITDSERLRLLEGFGVDEVVELPFTDETIHMDAVDFVKMLCDKLNMKYLCVGDDFRFGYKGMGDIKLLEALSKRLHYEFLAVKKVSYKDDDISSTRIRNELRTGNIKESNIMLGYDYFVGIKREKDNRCPFPKEKVMPPIGKYKCRLRTVDDVSEEEYMLKQDKEYCYWDNIGYDKKISESGEITLELLDYLG